MLVRQFVLGESFNADSVGKWKEIDQLFVSRGTPLPSSLKSVDEDLSVLDSTTANPLGDWKEIDQSFVCMRENAA